VSARVTAAVVGTALLLLACGAPAPEPATSVTSSSSSSVATTPSPHEPSLGAMDIWRTRCNQCHVRVEPQTRDRVTLTAALERHKKRARLSESDVQALVDYLAK
jgi:cytochrome c5